jgi:glycosyltransferase involved in cell wall biosynthesis
MGTTLLEPAAGPRRQGERATPRTVCHLIASNFFGGPEKQILEHCRRLDPARWQPVVASFREGRERVPIIEAARARQISTFTIDTRLPWNPDAARQLFAYVRRHHVDLLVTHGYKPDAVGFLMRRWSRVPQIAYVRGFTAETWRVRRYEDLDRWLLRRGFTRVLCVSEKTRHLLIEHGIAPGRVLAVHNAVEIPGDVEPAPLRAELGIPEQAPLLVAAGRLSAEKGHRFLVEALAKLKQKPEPHVIILGEGRESEALNRLARVLGVDNRIHLVGFRRDVLACLKAADVVVNPSLTEGLPNVVLEALSLEIPVVATEVGGVSEILNAGQTGWLVPAANVDALAGAIREALGDRARAREMAANGRRRIEEQFTFALQAERLMAVYDDAVGH